MNPTKLLSELVNAVDAYDATNPARNEMEGQNPSPELLRYWEAIDRAKDYLKKANSPQDDMGS